MSSVTMDKDMSGSLELGVLSTVLFIYYELSLG